MGVLVSICNIMLDSSLSDLNRYPLKLSDLSVMTLNPDDAPEKVIWASSPELQHNDLPCVGYTRRWLF